MIKNEFDKARRIFHSLRLVYRVTGYQRYRGDLSTDMRQSFRSPAVKPQMERTLCRPNISVKHRNCENINMAMLLKTIHRKSYICSCTNCEHKYNKPSYRHPYSTLNFTLILFLYEQLSSICLHRQYVTTLIFVSDIIRNYPRGFKITSLVEAHC